MRGEDLGDRHAGDPLARLQAAERRRLQQAKANEQADTNQQDADQEGQAPAPGEEVPLRHLRDQGEYADGTDVAERVAHLHHGAQQAPAARRRVLDHHQHRAAPLAAQADALQEAQCHQQHWGGQTDLRVRRQ